MKRSAKFFRSVILVCALPLCVESQVLNVPQVIQQQTEWCWAATSKCVMDYYDPTLSNSQCIIAEYARTQATWHNYGSVDCCTNPLQGCNYWNYMWGYNGGIEDILDNFAAITTTNLTYPLNITQTANELGAGNPFIFRWGWKSGGGHFLIGHGLTNSSLHYMNPWPGEGYKIASFSWVLDDGTSHDWTHTQLLCKPPSTPVAIKGNTTVCSGSQHTYSVSPIPGATSFQWVLPSGWIGSSATNTIQATVSVPGTISVFAQNACGTSISRTLAVQHTVIDTAVAKNGGQLIAHAPAESVSYQWIKCPQGSHISGATYKTFSPAQDGNYAVVINKGGCRDTSRCVQIITTGLSDYDATATVVVYPNPMAETLHLSGKGLAPGTYEIRLLNGLGQALLRTEHVVSGGNLNEEISTSMYSKGIYFVVVQSEDYYRVLKVHK